MTIYYATGIDDPSGNNYASTVRCYFFKTEEEAKEYAENAEKKYGYETDTGSFNGSKGWIFAWGTEDNDIRIKPMGESAARKICADWSTVDRALDVSNAEDDESRLFYFKKFTPGCWLTTSVDSPSGEGFKWQFDAYSQEIEESVKTETKMKHVKLFEAFVASQKLNENEDPHGDMTVDVYSIKGTKLKYAGFYAGGMGYSGTVCAEKDLQALEDVYLDGYEGKRTKDILKYATVMYDVYGEYCEEEESCDEAQKEKFAPLCKALKCDYYDLVFLEILHWELDEYTEEEYEYAEAKDQELEVTKKSFKLKGY